MSSALTLDTASLDGALSDAEYQVSLRAVEAGRETLLRRDGPGNDFLGWVDLPSNARGELGAIEAAASRIADTTDVLVVVGIGGSYLGARAVIEAAAPVRAGNGLRVVYAGHHLSGRYLTGLLSSLSDERVSVNVISKSGTTTEPALAFRIIKQWMEARYGRGGAAERIIATTDRSRGALRGLAEAEGYPTFVIPDDVGGRFSVLTPVGLLPIAAAGIDIAALLDGAAAERERALHAAADDNPALRYAALRQALWAKGKHVEILASFHPELAMVAEWWKQLYGESEGKGGTGIFPAAVTDTTDLHSLGQFIQDGARILFETFLTTAGEEMDLDVPLMESDADELNYLVGKPLAWVNAQALHATSLAHRDGGTPNMTITIPALDAHSIGGLLYFFEAAVAFSGYAQGVNPFDQPGVEAYKKNMFALLGKRGFEELAAKLRGS
jgi:glucose-6-phosphate isomerase